jgi:uridine kinase
MQPTSGVHVVGIAGPSGSGKTLLANALAERLLGGGVVFSLDAYYQDQRGVPDDAINVDVPEALDHHLIVQQLRSLVAGVPIQQPIYDYATHARASVRRTVVPAPYVIVEGLFALYWPELRQLIHTGVFLALDHAECLERRIARDMRERGRSRMAVAVQYERRVRPMYDLHVHPTRQSAHLILDARAPIEHLAARVVRAIEESYGAAP